jgi:exoribonuclease R
VTDKSALDEDAYDRGNSVYFPRRVIPMLPEKLSNGLCSLNPHVERLCMVCDMQVSSHGRDQAPSLLSRGDVFAGPADLYRGRGRPV